MAIAAATRREALTPCLSSRRKKRAARTIKPRLVETRPCTALAAVVPLALLPRLGFAMRRSIAEILARATISAVGSATGEFALAAKLPLGPVAIA